MTKPLCQKSKDYIAKTLGYYKDTDNLPKELTGGTIIHCYATEDTMLPGGDLDGFPDALFFDMRIYMLESETVYTIARRDQIEVEVPCYFRIFKDGSSMLIIDTDIEIDIHQSVTVRQPR